METLILSFLFILYTLIYPLNPRWLHGFKRAVANDACQGADITAVVFLLLTPAGGNHDGHLIQVGPKPPNRTHEDGIDGGCHRLGNGSNK
eukprot:scaffold351985_cov15-Prasinocladus_malaysianus.AAC.1